MRKTFQYKAIITQTTAKKATDWLSLCQQRYNLCLEQRITVYKQHKQTISTFDQSNQLPELKEAFPEFKSVGSQVLQDVVERIGKAFQGFFSRLKGHQGKAGFPRFRSRDRYDSFTLKKSGWKLDGKYLSVPGVGVFKLRLSRPIEGTIKTITIKRTSWGDWHVAFSCADIPPKDCPEPIKETIGIDVNILNFCTDSGPESLPVENQRFYLKAQTQLKVRQRRVNRRKKGSSGRRKAVLQVAKSHRRTANQRKDFAHKTARAYVNQYREIHIENLQIANMVKNPYLSKHIFDAAWGIFFQFLIYKAEEAGRRIVRVKPHGTSQECHQCHTLVPKTLGIRVHHCPCCGLRMDRDKNAANNIERRAGQTLQAVT